jgi:hypothetical protein
MVAPDTIGTVGNGTYTAKPREKKSFGHRRRPTQSWQGTVGKKTEDASQRAASLTAYVAAGADATAGVHPDTNNMENDSTSKAAENDEFMLS